jgi:pyruvyltransferase
LIYSPKIDKIYDRGYVPHYIERGLEPKDGLFIDALLPWREVVDKICSCKEIVSSSLHGIIIAEAYGIPATYASYSNKVIGGDFKFRDYLLGTGRKEEDLYKTPIPPIPQLKERQDLLINKLKSWYNK